jgi:GNAT superfamily N-acetyltransferase
MSTAETVMRLIEARDEARWRELWAGYCLFYGKPPDPEVEAFTWSRLMGASPQIFGYVAVDANDHVVGIANCVLHENTSTLRPVCYLQDLFVDPSVRANGIGKAMIEWLLARMHDEHWARVYWATREDNYRARGLYDQFTPHSGFLRYVVYNQALLPE